MPTLSKNPVIEQLRSLLKAAIELKEKFDKNDSIQILDVYTRLYLKELDYLQRICPSEVLSDSYLLRHSAFLEKYIGEQTPEHCYKDVRDICGNDIFTVEESYLKYLSDTSKASNKYYEWQNIHPLIRQLAQPRFENYHFADAVEASFKEINIIVKKAFKSKVGAEEDGVKLMRLAFTTSSNNNFTPAFLLADNSTESGKNIQEGYMNIFAGSMIGIRNPKAHANVNVNPDEAWEMIVLASHLMRMWEKFNPLQ